MALETQVLLICSEHANEKIKNKGFLTLPPRARVQVSKVCAPLDAHFIAFSTIFVDFDFRFYSSVRSGCVEEDKISFLSIFTLSLSLFPSTFRRIVTESPHSSHKFFISLIARLSSHTHTHTPHVRAHFLSFLPFSSQYLFLFAPAQRIQRCVILFFSY